MLTARQKQLVDFIAAETARTGGVAPTQRQMARALGYKSQSGITKLLRACVDRGALRMMPYKQRAIEVVGPPRAAWFAFDDRAKTLKPFDAGARRLSAASELVSEEASAS
jgi:SOS-response transcriptional repressor LexA